MRNDVRTDPIQARLITAVYVDGVKIPKSVMFDDEAGIVLSYAVNEQGRIIADTDGEPTLIEHHGAVTFDMKAQPE